MNGLVARSSAIVEGIVISSGVASCQSAAAFARIPDSVHRALHRGVVGLDVGGEAQVALGVLVSAVHAGAPGSAPSLRIA